MEALLAALAGGGNSSVTTFELLSSGAVKALKGYLQGADLAEDPERQLHLLQRLGEFSGAGGGVPGLRVAGDGAAAAGAFGRAGFCSTAQLLTAGPRLCCPAPIAAVQRPRWPRAAARTPRWACWLASCWERWRPARNLRCSSTPSAPSPPWARSMQAATTAAAPCTVSAAGGGAAGMEGAVLRRTASRCVYC